MIAYALARRAVAAPGWRWMPGMRTTSGLRVVLDEGPTAAAGVAVAMRSTGRYEQTPLYHDDPDVLPDLDDPATLGCLVALVRDHHHARVIVADPPGASVVLDLPDGSERYHYAEDTATVAEALVVALEAE